MRKSTKPRWALRFDANVKALEDQLEAPAAGADDQLVARLNAALSSADLKEEMKDPTPLPPGYEHVLAVQPDGALASAHCAVRPRAVTIGCVVAGLTRHGGIDGVTVEKGAADDRRGVIHLVVRQAKPASGATQA
jgi:hypothetical protein